MDVKNNLSAFLYGNTPIPDFNDNEILIRVAEVGICGTDITIVTKGKLGHLQLTTPTVTGHEASGTVVKVGSKVKHLKPGDRVVIEPNLPCQICEFCRTGNENLCENVESLSHPPNHGCLRRYLKHDANYCHKLPDNLSMEEGAVIEPLTCAIHGCLRGNIQLGSKVLVCGAGPIGLLCFLTAKAMGATNLCVTDIMEERLKFAKELGANSVINVRNGTNEENEKKIIELFGGSRPDFTLECSGAESAIRLGITTAMDLVSTGKINIKPLITHRFKLEDTAKAFETAVKNVGNVGKIIISC
ncbi:L-threonine 3-dehydrogenase [Armadillidium vulgare]|nr:L-threonine 3-dehydrogenase [Armadillidium vulgare]